jgi:hypothetical protein
LTIFAWATELRLFRFRSSQAGQAADLSNYFSKAFSLHNEHPGDAVLQFAIACLRSVNIDPANWPLFQKLLLLCVILESDKAVDAVSQPRRSIENRPTGVTSKPANGVWPKDVILIYPAFS